MQNNKKRWEFRSKLQSVCLILTTALAFFSVTSAACILGANQQCAEIGLTPPAGGLSISSVPDNFTFPPATGGAGNDRFSKEDTNYTLNVNDVITVEDLRNVSGFSLQLTASAFTDGTPPNIPLDNFYVVTTASSTGGITNNGVEYPSGYSGQMGIIAPVNTSGDVEISATFIDDGSYLGNGSSGIPVVLMDAGLIPPSGRTGTFKQNINYYLNIPGSQPPGDYQVTLTFDLIDDPTE